MVTRIALIDLPGLLAGVVQEAFAGEADLAVEMLPNGSGPQAILASDADVVIVGLADPAHYPPAEHLLREQPGLGLFAISPDARQAWIHELLPCARPLAEVSVDSLRWAVRDSYERRTR